MQLGAAGSDGLEAPATKYYIRVTWISSEVESMFADDKDQKIQLKINIWNERRTQEILLE